MFLFPPYVSSGNCDEQKSYFPVCTQAGNTSSYLHFSGKPPLSLPGKNLPEQNLQYDAITRL